MIFSAISFEYSRIVAAWAAIAFLVPIPVIILGLLFFLQGIENSSIRFGLICGALGIWAQIANIATGTTNGPAAWSTLLIGLSALVYRTLDVSGQTLLTPIPIIFILYLPRALGTTSTYGSLLILLILLGNTVLFTGKEPNRLFIFEFFIKSMAFVLSIVAFLFYQIFGVKRESIIGSTFIQEFLNKPSAPPRGPSDPFRNSNFSLEESFQTFPFVTGLILLLCSIFLLIQRIRRSMYKSRIINDYDFGAWTWFVHELKRYSYSIPKNVSPDTFKFAEFLLPEEFDSGLLLHFLSSVTHTHFSDPREQGARSKDGEVECVNKILDNFKGQLPLKDRFIAQFKV
jgi:hypothetical protein